MMMGTEAPADPIYAIRLAGHLGTRWANRFSGWTIRLEDGGTTLLVGPVRDQAMLFGCLRAVRDAGMTLISVNPITAST